MIINKILFFIASLLLLTACAKEQQQSPAAVNSFVPALEQQKTEKEVVVRYLPMPISQASQTSKIKKSSRKKSIPSVPVKKGLSAVQAANRESQMEPNTDNYVNSIANFYYMPGVLYQIYTAPLRVTDVEFEPGESITSIAAGDTLRWQVSKTYSGSGAGRQEHLLIKPTKSGVSNSLVVTTSIRTYHLELHSTDETYISTVRWRYPNTDGFVQNFNSHEKATSTAKSLSGRSQLNLNRLNFDYEIFYYNTRTPPSWLPQTVFNDGQRTYIQFPSSMQVAPTLLVSAGKNSSAQMVNYHVRGSYYIIDQVVQHIELRVGQTSPIIVRIDYKEKV